MSWANSSCTAGQVGPFASDVALGWAHNCGLLGRCAGPAATVKRWPDVGAERCIGAENHGGRAHTSWEVSLQERRWRGIDLQVLPVGVAKGLEALNARYQEVEQIKLYLRGRRCIAFPSI